MRDVWTVGTSVTAVRIVSPGSLVFIFIYTASFGCTRITNSFRGISLKIPLVTSLNWIRISVFCSFNAAISSLQTPEEIVAWSEGLRSGTFACFENKRDSVPSLTFDEYRECCECRASTIFWNLRVVQVPRLSPITNILSDNHILGLNRRNRSQNSDLE